MDFPIHQLYQEIIEDESMGADITSDAVNNNQIISFAIQAVWTGSSPVGSLIL